MNYSTNYNLNKPERSEQFNIDHWNNNTDAIDTQMHTNEVNIAQNATDIATLFTGLNTKNTSDTNSVYYKLMKLIYPVGSLYWSANSTNPSTLFGGTWTQIKDKFVLACGDTYSTTGATGGASSVTLAVTNLPSHNHSIGGSTGSTRPTFTGTAGTTGANNRGHTHNYAHTHGFTPAGTISKHSHKENIQGSIYTIQKPFVNDQKSGSDTGYTLTSQGYATGSEGAGFSNKARVTTDEAQSTFTGTAGTTSSQSTSTSGDESQNHTHSYTPAGTVSSHSHTLPANTGSKGSGTAFSIMPPYVVKYCWQRTA